MHNLPPEILSEIMALTVPAFPTINGHQWSIRQRRLARLTLVHSSWTRIAQRLLFAEFHVDLRRREVDRRFEGGLAEIPESDRLQTKSLTLRSPLNRLTARDVDDLFKNVKHVSHCLAPASVGTPDVYTKFRHLTTLGLHYVSIQLQEPEEPICFPQLRRLILGKETLINGSLQAYQAFFAPSCMPRLAQLSLKFDHEGPDPLDEVFARILPQITTLAISHKSKNIPQSDLILRLHSLPKLAHLAVDQARGDSLSQSLSARGPTCLRLDSLHLASHMLYYEPEFRDLLVANLRERKESRNVARIVLYWSEEETEDRVDLSELAALEWRSGEPPFLDFDGM